MKKILYWVVLVALIAIFLYSAYCVVTYYIGSQENEVVYEELAQLVVDRPTIPLPQHTTEDFIPGVTKPEQVLVTARNYKTGETQRVLPEYVQLYLKNPDLIGWISIDGTKINYPVVQSDAMYPNYYLNRNFDGKDSVYGCIYAAEAADVLAPSDNIPLFGHRMSDDSMFAQLRFYTDKSFWQDHQYIRFDSLQERHLYQIICVFAISAHQAEDFAYHNFVDAEDEDAFNAFLSQCEALRYYDTGLTAQYGDKLITLSTCEYSHNNGRLVVVAKQVA